eukprot:7000173-Pyramimonas_sp.AAC.1
MIGRGIVLRSVLVVCLCLLIAQSASAAKRKATKSSAKSESLVDVVAPYAPSLGLSAGLGTLVAMTLTNKVSPVALGLVAVLAGSLQSFGFITIHWDRISEKTMSTIDINRDGQLTTEDFGDFWLTGGAALLWQAGILSAFGFIAGFYLGLKIKWIYGERPPLLMCMSTGLQAASHSLQPRQVRGKFDSVWGKE